MKNSNALMVPVALLIALSACSTSSTSAPRIDVADSRYATLLNMPLPDFYGTLAIAIKVSNNCPSLQRNPRIDLELNERRNENGNGSFAALSQRQAIRNAQASMSQEFQNRQGGNLCSVAARDLAQAQKPYTFFLEEVG